MKTVKLYNGTETIVFDHVAHCYTTKSGAKPDGVTTILKLVPKYLLGWVARVTSEHIRDGILDRLETNGNVEPTFLASLCDEAKKVHTIKRDTAGDIGSTVHAFAEEALKTGVAPELPDRDAPEYAGCQAFLKWLVNTKIDPNTVQSERIVFSRRLFYAGTCDCFAQINGRHVVIDFKTGSGFYEEFPLQLAAYAMAIEEELQIEIRDGWIIHLDKQTGKMTPYYVEITDQLKTDWEAVRIAWRAVKRNQERHKEIKQAKRKAA